VVDTVVIPSVVDTVDTVVIPPVVDTVDTVVIPPVVDTVVIPPVVDTVDTAVIPDPMTRSCSTKVMEPASRDTTPELPVSLTKKRKEQSGTELMPSSITAAPRPEPSKKKSKTAKAPTTNNLKKARNAFNIFKSEFFPQCKKELTFAEKNELANREWRQVKADPIRYQVYKDLAAKDKARYENEVATATVEPIDKGDTTESDDSVPSFYRQELDAHPVPPTTPLSLDDRNLTGCRTPEERLLQWVHHPSTTLNSLRAGLAELIQTTTDRSKLYGLLGYVACLPECE
jgi:hypothetical protein